jgi:mRNA interferase MazF
MREIVIARLDKNRPALVLTREIAIASLRRITIAPITSTIRGLSSEIKLGQRNGLDHECVVSLDNIATVPKENIGRVIGFLLQDQERELARAIDMAFGLSLRHD